MTSACKNAADSILRIFFVRKSFIHCPVTFILSHHILPLFFSFFLRFLLFSLLIALWCAAISGGGIGRWGLPVYQVFKDSSDSTLRLVRDRCGGDACNPRRHKWRTGADVPQSCRRGVCYSPRWLTQCCKCASVVFHIYIYVCVCFLFLLFFISF